MHWPKPTQGFGQCIRTSWLTAAYALRNKQASNWWRQTKMPEVVFAAHAKSDLIHFFLPESVEYSLPFVLGETTTKTKSITKRIPTL